MAHQLKYYKEIESHGHLWRVEILQETEDTFTPMEIGPVLQGLRLVMQGEQADIDTPIVKTSLEMTFVDAPDHEEERKCGYWEEFYTSSATEYQVRLYKDGGIEWTGYVTPDSFSEDLRYRGSVSIIARDNLGTLQDMECDIDGQLNGGFRPGIEYLVTHAMRACQCKMGVVIKREGFPMPVGGNTTIDAQLKFDPTNLSNMTWWEALDKALYASGMVLRYVGKNTFYMQSYRDIPLAGKEYWWDLPIHDARFTAHAHRELAPGVKEITESVEFDTNEKIQLNYSAREYSNDKGVGVQTGFLLYNPGGTITDATNGIMYQVYGYTDNYGIEVSPAKSGLLNVHAYGREPGYDSQKYGRWDDPSILYYIVNSNDSKPVGYSRMIYTTGVTARLRFGKAIAVSADNKRVMNIPMARIVAESDFRAGYILKHTRLDNGAVRYYDVKNGKWESSEYINFLPLYNLFGVYDAGDVSIEIPMTLPAAGELTLQVINVANGYLEGNVARAIRNIYVRIKEMAIDIQIPEAQLPIRKLTTTTKYSDRYALALRREPFFAVYPSTNTAVALLPNAIVSDITPSNNPTFTGFTYAGIDDWNFHSDDAPQPLSVLIHQQMLAYYSKPNSILTGELILEDDVPDFCSLWHWGGRNHLLTSGTLNVLTGRMESAVLREFTRYDHMWETWVENEDIKVDYGRGSITILVHSNKALDQDSIVGLPSWITYSAISEAEGKPIAISLQAMENASGQERSAIFKVDTAYVRVTQRAAGDYGIDYGKDYS